MAEILKRFDPGSLLVMLVTFVLFVAALFLTGFTHDLLLEAGVFLVSVKLMIMSYKNSVAADRLNEQLGDIRSMLRESRQTPVRTELPDRGDDRRVQ
jgi:hypothetical protein